MQNLYNSIINNTSGLVKVEDLYDSSNMDIIRSKLISEGYDISMLSNRGISILFSALTDILFIVSGDSFYLATMCLPKIEELHLMKRLIPKDADDSRFSKTSQVIFGNTKQVINKYIKGNRFHLIKLNQVLSCKSYYFLFSVGGMSPYPTLENEDIYTLTNIGSWFNELNNKLITGCYTLETTDGFINCQSYLSRAKCVCTSGNLLTRDLDNNALEIPIWKIKRYMVYGYNDLEKKLQNGVFRYGDKNITLNKEVLEKYYGSVLYKKLESIGVRKRYCLEELISIGNKYSVKYYTSKYNLPYYCDSIHELEVLLRDELSKENKFKLSNIIHARVLENTSQLLAGHKSFYVTIDLEKLSESSFVEIENVSSILPREYKYYGISSLLGYNFVTVKATSDSLAMKYGETEFIRQFGNVAHFCTLVCEDIIVKGHKTFSLGINEQRSLCESIRFGYKENFMGYSKQIRSICNDNGLNYITDDVIKFLYINKLSRLKKRSSSLELSDVIIKLIDFLNTVSDKDNLSSELLKEYTSISYSFAYKEWVKINNSLNDLSGYIIEDTGTGKYIKTDYARFKLLKDRLSTSVDLYFRGTFLCTKRFK